jgi:hypothetical protein
MPRGERSYPLILPLAQDATSLMYFDLHEDWRLTLVSSMAL